MASCETVIYVNNKSTMSEEDMFDELRNIDKELGTMIDELNYLSELQDDKLDSIQETFDWFLMR